MQVSILFKEGTSYIISNIIFSIIDRRPRAPVFWFLVLFTISLRALGVNSVISPAQITVSSILSKIRSGSIKSIHSIIEEKGEVIEARALESSKIVGKPLNSLKLPKSICIGAVYKGKQLVIPVGETVIDVDDTLIIFVKKDAIKKLESVLSIRMDLI